MSELSQLQVIGLEDIAHCWAHILEFWKHSLFSHSAVFQLMEEGAEKDGKLAFVYDISWSVYRRVCC